MEVIVGWLVVCYIAHAIVCALYAAHIASVKGRDPWNWFFGGLLFGILGLLAAGLCPSMSEEIAEREAAIRRRQQEDESIDRSRR